MYQAFQMIFFREIPGPLKVVGVLLVLASMVGIGVRGVVRDRRQRIVTFIEQNKSIK